MSNHDTIPPVPELSPILHVLYYLLPRGIPFVFSGAEHYSQLIVNKEFGFSATQELRTLRERLNEDELALFNTRPIDWTLLPTLDTCTGTVTRHRPRRQCVIAAVFGWRVAGRRLAH